MGNSLVNGRARYPLPAESTSVSQGMSGKTVNVLLTQLRSPDEMQVTNTEGLRGMEAHFTLPGIALFKPRRPLRFNGS